MTSVVIDAKTAWRIEPRLVDILSDCPWPNETPVMAHQTAELLPLLEWQGPDGPVVVSACYDLLTEQETAGALDLRLQRLHGSQWWPLAILYNDAPTLSVAVEQAQAVALNAARQVQGAPITVDATFRFDLIRLAVILQLYLSGELGVVRAVRA